jgi:transposase
VEGIDTSDDGVIAEEMHIFERSVGGRRYRIAAQAVWDPRKQQPYSRQVVLGPADVPGKASLADTRTVGTRRVGDTGALAWVAEQLDVVGIINRACALPLAPKSASVGEMAVAVAVQRACAPGAKRDLGEFLDESVARISCLPGSAFTGQAFHRLAAQVDDAALERAQIELARAAVERFDLDIDVLAFDTTNFDTHIATTTPGTLPKRGHAKSKRGDLRVVGLSVLVSETGHVPLLYRTYAGNGSDQGVLEESLGGLRKLHAALNAGKKRERPGDLTLVRDGGSWSEQLELDLDAAGYFTLISLPLSHNASKKALVHAAGRGAMKALSGKLKDVRAARLTSEVGALKRTLVVVESEELLKGQKRGIAVALRKAKSELDALERRAAAGRIKRDALEQRTKKALAREHLSDFVVVSIAGTDDAPRMTWRVDAAKRRELERTRLGRRVLCTDRHNWSTARIVNAFRGQWNVEELFRRSKKGGVVPWGPSFQWADASLRFHTFATVLGLMLVSLARLALGTTASARSMMLSLAAVEATLVRTPTGAKGRPPTVLLAPDLSTGQARAVAVFELGRWLPALLSTRRRRGDRGLVAQSP